MKYFKTWKRVENETKIDWFSKSHVVSWRIYDDDVFDQENLSLDTARKFVVSPIIAYY